jgi:hypothetical protein
VLVIEGKKKGVPDFIAKIPVKNGKWLEVGMAFFNPRTESFTVYLDVVPDTFKVVLFKK